MLESGIGLGRASGFREALSGPERRASGSTAESGHGSTWSRGREESGSSWRKRGRVVRSFDGEKSRGGGRRRTRH